MRINKTTATLIISCIIIIYLIHRKRSSKLVNIKEVLSYSIYAAKKGGSAILKNKNNLVIKNKGLTKEGLEDKVTSADFSSHCSMVKTLKNKYPNANLISEEANTVCAIENDIVVDIENLYNEYNLNSVADEFVKLEDLTIWIDPLDATHEFTEKLYQYVTTMVCVALHGKPIMGVIHKPFQNTTSWAWVGRTSTADLHSTSKVDTENLRISISRSHSGKIKEILDKKLKNYELVVAAGAGYKSLQVAYREVDAYLHVTAIKKWDICAGNAILIALGGQMTDKHNQQIDYSKDSNVLNENGLIATLENHERFLGLL